MRKHILYIEGEPADGKRFTSTLRELGCPQEVFVCKDGREGQRYLESCGTDLPAIIVSEIQVPGMGGLVFLEWLKGEEGFRHIPLVFFTTVDDDTVVKAAYASQAAGYMIKQQGAEAYDKMLGLIARYWKTSLMP